MTLSMWARPAHGISSFSPSSAYSASSPSPADWVSLERKIRESNSLTLAKHDNKEPQGGFTDKYVQ